LKRNIRNEGERYFYIPPPAGRKRAEEKQVQGNSEIRGEGGGRGKHIVREGEGRCRSINEDGDKWPF